MKQIPVVGLLTVYPKRGPMQKLDLEDGELKRLMNAFSAESNARQVMVHDIWDNLKEIPTAATETASAKEAADNNQVKNQKP